ncbi:hypothetical protein BJX66DRAFT_291269 [Aspergillus keveii]|uniref:Uncharacterized protein n=1 Tax=Aspergillus keveii TaxID=714993 RepID=A0ABR4GNM8_9EURO
MILFLGYFFAEELAEGPPLDPVLRYQTSISLPCLFLKDNSLVAASRPGNDCILESCETVCPHYQVRVFCAPCFVPSLQRRERVGCLWCQMQAQRLWTPRLACRSWTGRFFDPCLLVVPRHSMVPAFRLGLLVPPAIYTLYVRDEISAPTPSGAG